MTAVVARLYICAIILIAALLFAAVDWFEPNRDVASLWATEAQKGCRPLVFALRSSPLERGSSEGP
jgi:hypothetical protein